MLSSSFRSYILEDSDVHKLNPIFKVLSLIIMLITSIFISSYIDCLMITSYLILSLFSSGISFKTYLKEIKVIYPFIIFVTFINVFTQSTFVSFLSDMCRLIFIILYILLFIHTTRLSDIIYGISKLLFLVRSYDKKNTVSLYISLAFEFPSVFENELCRIKYIYKEITEEVLKIKEKISLTKDIYILAFHNSLDILDRIRRYSYIKLYGYGKSRTNYYLHKFSIKEGLLLVLNIIILLIIIFY